MKKFRFILITAALAGCLMQAQVQAQETATADSLRLVEPGRVEFNPHWFLGVQAGASYTLGETDFGDLISPAAAIYAGYQFNPLFGLRAGLSGWEAKGAYVSPKTIYKYNYLQGNVDAMLDLGNLFCGYSPKRFFNAYLFLGMGVNGAFNNDDAVALASQGYSLEYLWDKNKVNVTGRGGLGANLRLSDNVFFNLEVNANVMSDKYNSKKAGNADWQFNALAGLTFKFGKTHRDIPPVYEEVEEIPVPAPAPEPEPEPAPAPAPQEPAEQPEVVKAEPVTENVFFRINSAVIRSSEEAKIDRIADFLAENPDATVSLCGYADKQTGTPAVNSRLSQRRAEAVAKALKAKGVDPSRIKTEYKGDTEQPFDTMQENRVCICITACGE